MENVKNKEILVFFEEHLVFSPNSLIVCSSVYEKYKDFCFKNKIRFMKYRLFRKSICEMEKNIDCVKIQSCYYFKNVTFKYYEN